MYKVYFGGAGIDDADIIAALYQAADDGCRVINMSLAGGPYNAGTAGRDRLRVEQGVRHRRCAAATTARRPSRTPPR